MSGNRLIIRACYHFKEIPSVFKVLGACECHSRTSLTVWRRDLDMFTTSLNGELKLIPICRPIL